MTAPKGSFENEATALKALLQSANPSVCVGVRAITSDLPDVLPDERLLLSSKAVLKRKREFQAGRAAARDALESLGVPKTSIGRHPNGSPIWPDGISGSITHSEDVALAAVWKSAISLGIDLEVNEELPFEMASEIASSEEYQSAQTAFGAANSVPRAVFCIKESVYKAISRDIGRIVDFREVEIQPDSENCTFQATAAANLSSSVRTGHVLAKGSLLTTSRHLLSYAENTISPNSCSQ